MNNVELFEKLRPIVMLVTGVPECILANPNKGAPNGEYCSIQPMSGIGHRGQPIQTRKTGVEPQSVDIAVRRQIACSANINFYRGDTRHRASKLEGCNKRSDVSAMLYRAGIGWKNIGPINDLTALQSGNYESRAQVNIELWYEETDDITINSIESVNVSVQYADGIVIESA